MKNKTKTQLLWFALVVLIIALAYMWYNPKVVEIPVEVPVMVPPPRPVRTQEVRREPEFRGPPIKQPLYASSRTSSCVTTCR